MGQEVEKELLLQMRDLLDDLNRLGIFKPNKLGDGVEIGSRIAELRDKHDKLKELSTLREQIRQLWINCKISVDDPGYNNYLKKVCRLSDRAIRLRIEINSN